MPLVTSNHARKWWKEATIYEIYPASFYDSNNDGVGDIPGIISKLDYLQQLGVDVIWLAPHYKSPQIDMGYDISDFEDIHAPYGSLADCEELIKQVHDRDMKIIFDLVINHTSDQHPWFAESRSSKTNPKRDWYFWRPARLGPGGQKSRPNNWRSQFTAPAWTWDEVTEEYYLHVYASAQPDLNWENEECRRAIYDTAIRFWLDRGVDGFRIDTVNKYSKVPGLPDTEVKEASEETQVALEMYTNGPRIHEFLREVRDVMDEYCKDGRDIFVVGELPATPKLEDVLKYISSPLETDQRAELDMVFNFDVVNLGTELGNKFVTKPFTSTEFKHELTKWQRIEDGRTWTTVFLENHDQPRSVSRFASDDPVHREMGAKMLATILCGMSGTLCMYQGQELGMANMPLEWGPEEYKCVRSQNYYHDIEWKYPGNEQKAREARDALQKVGRDHARIPMAWRPVINGGFCGEDVKPWMRALEDFDKINAADQMGRDDSVFNYWKKLLELREKWADFFVYGTFHDVEQLEGEEAMVYFKDDGRQEAWLLVVANLSAFKTTWTPPAGVDFKLLELLISNTEQQDMKELKPFEARIYIARFK